MQPLVGVLQFIPTETIADAYREAHRDEENVKVARILTLPLLAGTLVACASPTKMRQSAPELELRSPLPAKAVAICIFSRWKNADEFEPMPVKMDSVDGGYSVYWLNEPFGYTMLLADVNDARGGSITRYYKHMAFATGYRDEDIIECQESRKDSAK